MMLYINFEFFHFIWRASKNQISSLVKKQRNIFLWNVRLLASAYIHAIPQILYHDFCHLLNYISIVVPVFHPGVPWFFFLF